MVTVLLRVQLLVILAAVLEQWPEFVCDARSTLVCVTTHIRAICRLRSRSR